MSPSDRHTELRNMAARWIENKSFKRCSVPECNAVGYVADLVVLAGLFDAFHSRWTRYSNLEKKVMIRDWQSETEHTHRIEGDIDRWYVCVFEIKISRADFLNTFGNKNSGHSQARQKPVGTAHWVVADKGICKPEELPEFWGLLEPYGTGLSEKKIPKLNILPDEELHAIAFDMMWLEKNHRYSYYEQRINMADAIGDVHRAILENKPREELLALSEKAKNICNGMCALKETEVTI